MEQLLQGCKELLLVRNDPWSCLHPLLPLLLLSPHLLPLHLSAALEAHPGGGGENRIPTKHKPAAVFDPAKQGGEMASKFCGVGAPLAITIKVLHGLQLPPPVQGVGHGGDVGVSDLLALGDLPHCSHPAHPVTVNGVLGVWCAA